MVWRRFSLMAVLIVGVLASLHVAGRSMPGRETHTVRTGLAADLATTTIGDVPKGHTHPLSESDVRAHALLDADPSSFPHVATGLSEVEWCALFRPDALERVSSRLDRATSASERRAVYCGMALSGRPEVVPWLVERMRHEADFEMQRYLVNCLSKAPASASAPALLSTMHDETLGLRVRCAAAEATAELMAEPGVLDSVERLARSTSEGELRKSAVIALANTESGWPIAREILSATQDPALAGLRGLLARR